MSTAYHVVSVISALWVGFSGYSLFTKQGFVAEPLEKYGVPRSLWNPLALAKSLGAIGLLGGLWIPGVGIAAAIGLIVYFVGAVITTLWARSFKTTVFPVLYLVPVIATLILQLSQ